MPTSERLLDTSLKEYEFLRAEVITTVERQYSLANWGVSAVAVIIAAIIGGWQTVINIPVLVSAILVFIIPFTMTSYVISWAHTITKLNQLGARLYQIEENIASSFSQEDIKGTFNLPATETVQTYRFTLGWEHTLWSNGTNNRIKTTVHTVGLILAIFYLIVIAGNSIYIAKVGLCSSFIMSIFSILAISFWGFIWFLIFRYLQRRTIDASLPNL